MSVPAAEIRAALQGRYTLERELGRGGMATVFLAQDRKLHRRVALKLLHSDLTHSIGAARFQRETAILARLMHPHILPLYDTGEAEGRLFYVMPYVEGESLRQRLTREGQLPVGEALRIVPAIAAALDYAHAQGVVHRDIKPENILLAKDPAGGPPDALVADFGIAQALDAAGAESLTAPGLSLGTPAYMSPEQGAGERVDGRSDVYALGCVAYEMLAGVPPFSGPTAQAVLARHAVDQVPPLQTVRTTVPEAVARAIERALAKAPADRFATAGAFGEALTGGAEILLPRHPSGSRFRSRWLWGSGLAAAGLLAGGGTLLFRGPVPPVSLSPEKIAVLPFLPATPDTGLSRLGSDLAMTLSASLSGVGGIQTADRLSMAAATAHLRNLSLSETATLARRFGAGSMLRGTLVALGQQVRLDLALYGTQGLEPLAEGITVTASRDSVTAMTDSLVWQLLQQIWRHGKAPSPGLASVTTRSIPALRAFLDGERQAEGGNWSEASLAYQGAIGADSTFWLAHFRNALTRYWLEQPVDSQLRQVIREHRKLLSEQEALLADAFLTSWDSVRVKEQRSEAVTRRFPDYWPGWFLYGDFLYHNGPTLGRDWSEGLQAFQRVVALNPKLVPAWQHLMMLATGKDQAEAERARDHLVELGYFSRLPPGLRIAYQLTDELGRNGGVITPALYGLVDSQAALALQAHREEGIPGNRSFLQGPQLGLLWLGFPLAQLQYNRRALRVWVGARELVTAAHAADAWALAARGQWDSALAAMQEVASAHPGPVVNQTPMLAVENYALAVLAAWLGVTEPSAADQRRPSAVAFSEGLAEDTDRREARGRVAWLDGLLGYARANRSAIARARLAAVKSGSLQAQRIDRSLAAFDQALAGDRIGAGRTLAELEEDCAEHVGCNTFTPSISVQRLAAAEWLRRGGNRERAARLLRWQDALSGPQWLLTTEYALSGPTYLARARLEESGGDPRLARGYYQQFLRWYDSPMPSQVPLVEEARAALARLVTDQ